MKKILAVILFVVMAYSLMAMTIHDIQYTEEPGGDSPYMEQVVTIEEAVVTAVGWTPNSGHASFFLADPMGGPWCGIMVYDYDEAYVWSLAEGDLVTITATVDEYYGFTELGFVEECEVIGSIPVHEPLMVTTLELSSSESLESCLVKVDDVTVTAAQNGYGEWFVTDGSGACQVDDSFFYLDDIDPPIVIEVDDFWGRLVGIVDYSYDEYGLHPRYPEDMYPNSGNDGSELDASSAIIRGNYPNPFNPTTQIEYSLDQTTSITFSIFDIEGRLVKTLYQGLQERGDHSVIWNGNDRQGNAVASGIYFSRLSHSKGVDTHKILLLK